MKIFVRASLGIAIGAVLLWGVISQIDLAAAGSVLGRVSTRYMIYAVAVYWLSIGIRIARWRLLLSKTASLSFMQVAQCLVVGYAVNNILPARLGEFFRADFLGRRFGLSRSAAFGSIVVERALDGLIAIALLAFGLAMANLQVGRSALLSAAVLGAAVIGLVVISVLTIVFWHDRLPLERWPWLGSRLSFLAVAMTVVRRPVILIAVAASIVAWCLEAAAILLIIWGFGVDVSAPGLCLIVGSASLSTLLPSAPGYVGSLQVGFALSFSALGLAPVLGVFSATATQVFLLGSITVVGLAFYLINHLYGTVSFARRRAGGSPCEGRF